MAADSKRLELKIGGIGGQGVLLAAQLVARAGVREYQHVTWFPSYGVRMRGGDSTCTVIMSDSRIHSPILSRPKAMVMMHLSTLDRFEDTVAPGGLIVVDASLIERKVGRGDVEACYVPASAVGLELGSSQLANMVLLGAYLACSQALPLDTVESAAEQMFGDGREHLLVTTREALRRGFAAAPA